MRPFSTLGWFMLETVGAVHIDETTNPIMQAWMVDAIEPIEGRRSSGMAESVGYVIGVDRDDGRIVRGPSRRGGKRAAMRLAIDQAKAECEPREEGVIYVRG